jgi:aldehyde dehydrogenase (NAD+)
MNARGSATELEDLPETVLIDGVWRAAWDGRTRQVVGPLAAARVADAGPRDAAAAVRAARLAFDEGPWPRMPGRERAQILYEAADLVEEASGRLAWLQAVEMGKPIRFGERDDVPFATMALRFFAAMASQQVRGSRAIPSGGRIALHEPRGVVGALCAFHHPLAMAAAVVAPALAMGDTVVLKPPMAAARSVVEFARLCQDAGIPPGTLNVVTGGPDLGCALAANREVDLVSFLGSVPQGRQLATACAGQFVPTDFDLGLPNAHVVFEDACLEHAAWQAARSLLPGRAEFRASGVRVLVHEKVYAEFASRLGSYAAELAPGDPRDPKTRLGPLADVAQRGGLEDFLAHGLGAGARLLPVAGEARGSGYDEIPSELLVAARLLEIPRGSAAAVAEVPDVFAPLALLTPFREIPEAVAVLNQGSGTRSCDVYTTDLARAGAVAEALCTGVCRIHACRTDEDGAEPSDDEDADEGLPLREFDLDSARAFTRQKAVWVDVLC